MAPTLTAGSTTALVIPALKMNLIWVGTYTRAHERARVGTEPRGEDRSLAQGAPD